MPLQRMHATLSPWLIINVLTPICLCENAVQIKYMLWITLNNIYTFLWHSVVSTMPVCLSFFSFRRNQVLFLNLGNWGTSSQSWTTSFHVRNKCTDHNAILAPMAKILKFKQYVHISHSHGLSRWNVYMKILPLCHSEFHSLFVA